MISLWFKRVAFQWLVILPWVRAACQGINQMSISVHPEGLILVKYGQPLEMFCTDERYTADDLEFVTGGATIPSEKVNATTRRLSVERHAKGVFAYYCRNKVINKVCPSRVLVDSAPMDVTDFACKSSNLESINCTWTSPKRYCVTNYSLTFFINGQARAPCITEKSEKIRYCYWNTTMLPRYRQTEKQYFFNLLSCNAFECIEQNFTVDHFSIVKPDPPRNLKVLGNDSHSVLLQWSIPNNMVDFLPNGVDHKIEYQIAKTDNTSYFREVNTSSLPAKNKTYKFLLSDLPYAHMQYEVRIYIKAKEAVKSEFWSDFTYIVFYTASERPKRPPDTVVGAFDQASYETKRVIYVYWKQLEEYEEAGANFTYKVVAHQEMRNPKTLIADHKKSLSFVILNEASLGAINVDIWSTNDNGSSLNKSHLYIPPVTETEELTVSSFTKLVYGNGTFKLSWVGMKNIDNYTLFWCQHNITNICLGRIDFAVLDPTKTNHQIDLPRQNKYQFSISANRGTKASGMFWATCDISNDGIPMYKYPVKLYHGIPGTSFVNITWTMACPLQESIITGYQITYCLLSDKNNMCDTTIENKSIVNITDLKQMNLNITGLKPFRTYLFSFALSTIYGIKKIEYASTVVTTSEDTPTSPRNVSITDVGSDSITITWDPPLHKNGIVGKYVIYNGIEEFFSVKVNNDNKRMSKTLEGLEGFSNYTWSVAACNVGIRTCSQSSPINGIFVRTRIGTPNKLNAPVLDDSNHLTWQKPDKPNGPISLYQILQTKSFIGTVYNTTYLFIPLYECEEDTKYQVRAVNYDDLKHHGVLGDAGLVQFPLRKDNDILLEFKGEWSDSTPVFCKRRESLTLYYIIMAVTIFLAVNLCVLKKRFRHS